MAFSFGGAPSSTPAGGFSVQSTPNAFGGFGPGTASVSKPTAGAFGTPSFGAAVAPAPTIGGFGGFGSAAAKPAAAPSFGSFGTPTTTNAAASMGFGFGATNKPTAPGTAFAGFGSPQTVSTAGGGFGTGFSAIPTFGSTPGFGASPSNNFGTGTNKSGFSLSAYPQQQYNVMPSTTQPAVDPNVNEFPLDTMYKDLPQSYKTEIDRTWKDMKQPMKQKLAEMASNRGHIFGDVAEELRRIHVAVLRVENEQRRLQSEIKPFLKQLKADSEGGRLQAAVGLQQIRQQAAGNPMTMAMLSGYAASLGINPTITADVAKTLPTTSASSSYVPILDESLPCKWYCHVAEQLALRLDRCVETVHNYERQLSTRLLLLQQQHRGTSIGGGGSSGVRGSYGELRKIGIQELVELIQEQAKVFVHVAAAVAKEHKEAETLRQMYLILLQDSQIGPVPPAPPSSSAATTSAAAAAAAATTNANANAIYGIHSNSTGSGGGGSGNGPGGPSSNSLDPFSAADRQEVAERRLIEQRIVAESLKYQQKLSQQAQDVNRSNPAAHGLPAPQQLGGFNAPSAAGSFLNSTTGTAAGGFGAGFAPPATATTPSIGGTPIGAGFGTTLGGFGNAVAGSPTNTASNKSTFAALDLATPSSAATTGAGAGFGSTAPAATFGAPAPVGGAGAAAAGAGGFGGSFGSPVGGATAPGMGTLSSGNTFGGFGGFGAGNATAPAVTGGGGKKGKNKK
mmetsp:Transcript_10869/g.17700  ORF Transcript_10869/g.17700 Transcript_10869/m.17700 type:complete len:735 (-) Transcript_10869:81-2285(-)